MIEKMLMKYSYKDQYIFAHLREFDISISDDTVISNAVVENSKLKGTLSNMKKTNKRMRKELERLENENKVFKRGVSRMMSVLKGQITHVPLSP